MNKKVKTTLATIGLLIVIFLVLRGVFDLGKIGFKSFLSKLPTLKCEIFDPNAKNPIYFYDLEDIKNNDPLQGLKKVKEKYLEKSNLEIVTFGDDVNNNKYRILFRNHVNGIDKGYSVTINKSSGKVEVFIPLPYPVGSSFSQILDATREGQYFEGECVEVKRKNL